MSLKQLFYAAVTARIISWVSLGVFFFCLVAELELKPAVMALGISHLSWMLGTMFLGVFREQMEEIASRALQSMVEAVDQEETPVDLKDVTSHPIFEEEEGTDD